MRKSSLIKIAYITTAIALMLGTTEAQNLEITTSDGMLFTAEGVDKKHIKFVVHIPKNSYFAIGFNSEMPDTDMIVWSAYSDTGAATDLWCGGYKKPLPDAI